MASQYQKELCNECDEDATCYCIQDDANFCDQHKTSLHLSKSHRVHKIIPIDEKTIFIKNKDAVPPTCKLHHMPLCLYCSFCKVRVYSLLQRRAFKLIDKINIY